MRQIIIGLGNGLSSIQKQEALRIKCEMAAILQRTFQDSFSCMKIAEYWLKFHRHLFSRVKLRIWQQQFSLNSDGAIPWWRYQMETFSMLLALCAGNSPGTGEFPLQRPVTPSFDVSFDMHLNKWFSKSKRQWFEMPSHSLWHYCNVW